MSAQITPRDLWRRATDALASDDRPTARSLLTSALEISAEPIERCISSHYLSIAAGDVVTALDWARASVEHAAGVDLDEVGPFLPRIYLTLADAYRRIGDPDSARSYYLHAASAAETLESTGVVEPEETWSGVATGLASVGFIGQGLSDEVFGLVEGLLAARCFGALSVLLPAIVRCVGTDTGVRHLVETMDTMFWTPGLIAADLRPLLAVAMAAAEAQLSELDIAESAQAALSAAADSTASDGAIAGLAQTSASEAKAKANGENTPDVPFHL